jgi:20S proteasome alpha/beta subunit
MADSIVSLRRHPVDFHTKRKYPLQPPGKTGMSVAVGIVCTDGIVLASDEQISIPDYSKHHEKKLDGWADEAWTVAHAYAGSPSLMREATDKIKAKIEEGSAGYNPQSVHAAAESVLEDIGYKFTNMELQLLIATATQTELELLRFDGGNNKALYVSTSIEILGVGDSSLLRYLSDALYEKGKIDVAFGAALALYMVEKAKNYVNHCGGQTDFLIIRKGNQLESWRPYDCFAVYNRMQRCEKEFLRRIIESGKEPNA